MMSLESEWLVCNRGNCLYDAWTIYSECAPLQPGERPRCTTHAAALYNEVRIAGLSRKEASDSLADRTRIALVGNGPIAAGMADAIDGYDLVVRFNACSNYGASGYRTDVLVLVNTGPSGRRFAREAGAINPAALSSAKAFWLAKPADVAEAEFAHAPECAGWDGPWDHAEEIVKAHVGSRPWQSLGADTFHLALAELKRYGASDAHQPSTGILALLHIKASVSWPSVTLFGFTHEGWQGHCWDAERRFVDRRHNWIGHP